MIDIYINQKSLWNKGNDFYSPITKIYNTIEKLEVDIMSTPAIDSKLLSGYITPSQGYMTSGVAFVPDKYTGKAIVLGNDGIVTQSNLFYSFSQNCNLKFYYVDTIDDLYLSTGMLILSENAINGNGAILIGDDGVVRSVVYNGKTFNTIYYTLISVTASFNYPTAGILLTRIDVTSGNAGILFGSDNNIHYVQYSS